MDVTFQQPHVSCQKRQIMSILLVFVSRTRTYHASIINLLSFYRSGIVPRYLLCLHYGSFSTPKYNRLTDFIDVLFSFSVVFMTCSISV